MSLLMAGFLVISMLTVENARADERVCKDQPYITVRDCCLKTKKCPGIADEYFKAKNFVKAAPYYEEACKYSINTGACFMAAITAENNQEKEKVVLYAKKACDLKDLSGCATLGALAIEQEKDISKGLKFFEKARGLRNMSYLKSYASALKSIGNLSEAKFLFKSECARGVAQACEEAELLSKEIQEFCGGAFEFSYDRNEESNFVSKCKNEYDLPVGRYVERNNNYEVLVEGRFNGEGEKIGDWNYFQNGKLVKTDSGKVRELAQKKEAKVSEEARLKSRAEQDAKEKLERDKATAAQKGFEQSMPCRCQQYQASIEQMIVDEKEVGVTVGFVNKEKLHKLGSQLLMVKKLNAEFISGGKAANSCKKYSLQEQAECAVAASQKYMRDRGL